ncbi:MAG TPA: hypothetical protein VJM34_04390 [Novosphingobium sp.]|nr:hypothetical protein [Novosphingobium sp.]
MFGPKIRNVFKSRWHALLWSASILLTAYCTVPSPDDPAQDADAAKTVEGLLSHGDTKPAEHHVNPWAKDANE